MKSVQYSRRHRSIVASFLPEETESEGPFFDVDAVVTIHV
jgi:hypothetical protein